MLWSSLLNTKHLINYVLHGPHPTHEIIYIKDMQLAYAQYIKQIIMFMCSGVLGLIYIIKHQSNIIRNGAYAHEWYVKMRDITIIFLFIIDFCSLCEFFHVTRYLYFFWNSTYPLDIRCPLPNNLTLSPYHWRLKVLDNWQPIRNNLTSSPYHRWVKASNI